MPNDPNRPEGFDLESLQEKAEKIQAGMTSRRSTAGAVVVRYHLEPTKVQIFLRCSDQKLDVRRKRNVLVKNTSRFLEPLFGLDFRTHLFGPGSP